ncbi:MAG: ATP-binding protein [bacterium]
MQQKSITVSSETKNIRKVVLELVSFVVATAKVDEDDFPLVLSEAVANAMIHGNKKNPEKKVMAQANINSDKVIVKIADEGEGFDFQNLPDPTKPENFRKCQGRGLFLIRSFMDDVRFNSSGSEIIMEKHIR